MSRRANPTLVGVFVVGAVVVAVAGAVILSSGTLFREAHPFIIYFRGSVNGLRTGAPVKFRGVEVGRVTGVFLNVAPQPPLEADIDVGIPVTIELDARLISEAGAQVDLGDPETMERLIGYGMRAQLATESIVTGRLYVALDLHPDTPVLLANEPGVPYQEIPSLPTAMGELRAKLESSLSRVAEVDAASMVAALERTLLGIDELVRSPALRSVADSLTVSLHTLNVSIRNLTDHVDQRVPELENDLRVTSEQAQATFQEAQATLASIRALVDPDSPTASLLRETLTNLSDAARSLQLLAEYLERNPGALVRGKASKEEQ